MTHVLILNRLVLVCLFFVVVFIITAVFMYTFHKHYISSRFLFLKLELTMKFLILDFKVPKYGTQSLQILNFFHIINSRTKLK